MPSMRQAFGRINRRQSKNQGKDIGDFRIVSFYIITLCNTLKNLLDFWCEKILCNFLHTKSSILLCPENL